MKVKTKNINDYTREINVDIPWSEIESDFEISLRKFSKKVKMPGFRSGKIPRDRLLSQFQANIEADFLDSNFQKYYLAAINQESLNPVNKAEVKDIQFHMNEDLSFLAVFEVEPDVKLPKLKKNTLSVQRTAYIHDDQDIEDAIMQLRKANASMSTVEDGAIEGDYLVCTLQKLDDSGVAIIGKKFEKQYLRVGNGSFTDNQKDKMIGLKPGGSTRLRLPVNQDGGDADYELTVDKVEREMLPELNDEFVKQINPSLDSIDSLKLDVEKKIIENFRERSKTAYERDLADALIEKTNPSFAPSMVEYYLKNLIEDVKKQNSGEPLDDEKVRDHYMPVAERNVKWYALRNKLIDHGKLEVSKDDLNAEIERLVEANTSSENEIRKFYKKPSNLKRLEDGLMEKIILEYLEQFAKVKEVEVQTKDLRGKENEY